MGFDSGFDTTVVAIDVALVVNIPLIINVFVLRRRTLDLVDGLVCHVGMKCLSIPSSIGSLPVVKRRIGSIL